MKTITELKPQSKNSKRVSVYLNGDYYCGLDLLTTVKYRLKVGTVVEESELMEIQKASEMNACFDSALKVITKSIKTEREVKEKLIKKGYLPEIISEVILKLKNYKYLDDKDYSERYVSTYKNYKGKKLIEFELKRKGVKEKDFATSLNNIESEYETALKIAEKYVKNKEKDVKTLKKCYKYLVSKGFTYEDSLKASKTAISVDEEMD